MYIDGIRGNGQNFGAAAMTGQFGGYAQASAMPGAAMAMAMPFDSTRMSRETLGMMNNGAMNQMGQNGQMDQQTSGMLNTLCGMFKQMVSMFQQWMNGGQAANQNGLQNQQGLNGANGANNGGANGAVNGAMPLTEKSGLISGTNLNNSVYGPNGLTMKPLDKYTVSSEFGNRPAMNDYHTGIDLAAPTGSSIRDFKSGTVTKVASDPKGYGNYVEVTHPDGTKAIYGHMSKFGNIKPGMQIGAGSVIGYVGSTGRSTGPHLHFEYRDASGKAVNPRTIMNF
jgi:murein DD-endopeptidase MepM/ murein hydrolase activator NlpD